MKFSSFVDSIYSFICFGHYTVATTLKDFVDSVASNIVQSMVLILLFFWLFFLGEGGGYRTIKLRKCTNRRQLPIGEQGNCTKTHTHTTSQGIVFLIVEDTCPWNHVLRVNPNPSSCEMSFLTTQLRLGLVFFFFLQEPATKISKCLDENFNLLFQTLRYIPYQDKSPQSLLFRVATYSETLLLNRFVTWM